MACHKNVVGPIDEYMNDTATAYITAIHAARHSPLDLRLIKGFHDEALRGEWKGHRSSRLGLQYRVIYEVVASEILIKVVDVTAHDYRRK